MLILYDYWIRMAGLLLPGTKRPPPPEELPTARRPPEPALLLARTRQAERGEGGPAELGRAPGELRMEKAPGERAEVVGLRAGSGFGRARWHRARSTIACQKLARASLQAAQGRDYMPQSRR